MPTSRHRLVFYCTDEIADEVRRLAALDGRTVSNWLSRLVSDAVAVDAAGGFAPFSPVVSTATASEQTPTPPAADAGAHAPQLPPRRVRDDPEYAEWLKRRGEMP